MKEYEVITKNGRPYLRHWHTIYQGGYRDMTIYGAKTATPYVKWNWLRFELDDDMKHQLARILGA